jgi:hypothetical protein
MKRQKRLIKWLTLLDFEARSFMAVVVHYWLLLHFQYTTKPYHATGSSSIGNEVLEDLKAVFPEYAKGSDDIFEKLSGQLEFAKKNAQRSLAHALTDHTDNPTTYVHELVDYLQKLK